ncbi:BspA family leucine-rich repeat surface protein [uncultured Lactobacillus sp.]|uniref:BspA family leucine-rich repeat surface protein n=1 Tax=uncultured Lactobacillus sp. TaxID=153152 RepID=UPI00259506D1|nr:BspA family leucine-rich repeat surface protein [uncultured Lactobacillus sp.]
MHEQKNVYSLRKLSVGLASVIVGTCFFISNNGQNVKADTLNVGEQQASTVIQQDSSKKQKQDSNEQNDQANVSNSKTEQQQSTNERNDVENVDSDLNDTNKLDNADDSIKKSTNQNVVKQVESEANQKFDQVKDQFKQETPVKQAPVNEPPTVFNKDTNTNLNSNLNKNTIKQALETSLLKDTTKPETTNTFYVRKSNIQANVNSLKESKAVNLNNNGGFDEATWGKLDVNDWKGYAQGDYYVLTHYVADNSDDAHIVVPNEADFEKAGISTGGKQVAVTKDFFRNIRVYSNTSARSIKSLAFSKTAGKQVKAIGNDWTDAFSNYGFSKFNGENLDVSEVTNMDGMFENCSNLSDISSLANWDTSNVTDMDGMFANCINLSNISPLANWDTSKVNTMGSMFENCSNLSDISSLANWDTSKVTSMWHMFNGCESLSDIGPLAHWDTSKVISMTYMFKNCSNLSDISPLAHWDTSKVITMSGMFENCSNLSDISPLANWDTSKVNTMSGMFENTPLKKVTLTNWDFSNINSSYGAESIFPDTNFEATLSDKTSKSLLDVSSKLSDSAKENLKGFDSAPIVDGVPDVNGDIQQYLDQIKQGKEWYQQQLAYYKQQIDYYKKELADPNADAATKENNQHELKQAEQEYQYYLTGDGKKEYDGQIQDLQEQFNQYKQEIQQEINQYKLQAEYPLNSVFGNHSKITTPNQDLLVYLVGKLPVKSDATRTIEITLPDGTKKTINQSVGYGKHAISGTADMATHKLDMSMPYELSKWELIKKEDGSYDLVKAHVDENGVASFDNVALPKVAGYKAVVTPAKQNAINPMVQMFMVSFVALPKQPNTEQLSPSSSSVTDKANNSHDLHDNSKKQNDQSIISNNETDHTINVSAQAVDPTVELDEHNVASQNNSTTFAQTQQTSTTNAEQPENISNADHVVNDQTDDDNFDDSSREYNDGQGSESTSNWSKSVSGKIIHVDTKNAHKGLNEPSKAQSVVSQPSNSVIKNSETSAKQLPQTGESDGFNYSALGVLLGLNVAISAVGVEKKRKKY